MDLSAATDNFIENLKATVEETNNELRKTNENLTQLWETANKALTKATNNEESIIHTKSELQKTNEKLTQLWVAAKEEALAKAISNEKSIQKLKASNDFTYEDIKDELSRQLKSELQKEMADMKQWQINHKDTARILADIHNLKEESEDHRNRLMRSTLIFRGLPEG